MKLDNWKLATLLAVGAAADSYLDAFAHSQNGGNLPPPGVVFSEPDPHPNPQNQHHLIPAHNNYLPPSPPSDQWFLPHNMKHIDMSSIIPIGISLATVLKIILKILIFKMIVKFVAVMCALLFLPKLEKDEKEMMMMMTTTTSTTTSTIKPDEVEESRKIHRILRAISEPPTCAEGDSRCDFWQTFRRVSNSSRSSGKRSQLSAKKEKDLSTK